MKIAYFNPLGNVIDNKIFNDTQASDGSTVNDRMDRWIALKNFLKAQDITIQTYDMYKNRSEIDIWLVQDPVPKTFWYLLTHGIRPSKVVLMLVEQPVGNPWAWKYLSWYKPFFNTILTWNTDLVKKDDKFIHCNIPVGFEADKYESYRKTEKANLCVMMHSNQVSDTPGELYTMRRKMIKYFEDRGDNLLDLYGHRWNTDKTPSPFYTTLYKGVADDKRLTFSKYYFANCLENSVNPGQYEYDIFISMAIGIVPIFLPPPDWREAIPEDTFINLADFPNWDDLVKRMQSMKGRPEYEAMIKKGWDFINSPAYHQFTIKAFCQSILTAIKRQYERRR